MPHLTPSSPAIPQPEIPQIGAHYLRHHPALPNERQQELRTAGQRCSDTMLMDRSSIAAGSAEEQGDDGGGQSFLEKSLLFHSFSKNIYKLIFTLYPLYNPHLTTQDSQQWVILKVTRFETSSAYSECTFLFSHLANLTQAATSEAD